MATGAGASELQTVVLAAAFQWAAHRYLSRGPQILALFLGWAGVWVVVEMLVIRLDSTPGRPAWTALHLSYFWGTAYWEVAVLRSALRAAREQSSPGIMQILDHRAALRFLALKLILLPAIIVGTVALLIPGLYIMARFGPAFLFVVQGQTRLRTAVTLSDEATRGRRGYLMLFCLSLLFFNVFGAALLGLGLIVTIPMSLLMCAHLFHENLSSYS